MINTEAYPAIAEAGPKEPVGVTYLTMPDATGFNTYSSETT